MAQLQSVNHGVAEFADADLQGAAVAHQARAIQADRVIRRMQALIGRREQVVLVPRVLDQRVECLGGHRRRSEHERHLPIDLADDDEVSACLPLRRQVFEQIEGDIGIRSQAIFRAALDAALGDELRHDIDAVGGDVARHMSVVAADVVALRMADEKLCAGVQKELDDFHVAGHARAVQIRHVVERHASAEQPRHQGFQEPALELARPLRRAQAQRGENRQAQAWIAPRPVIELVGQRVGLAYTQGQRQDDMRSDAAQGVFDAFRDIVKDARHVRSWASAPRKS